MATTSHPNAHMTFHTTEAKTKAKRWAVPMGRFLFSLMFIISGLSHFTSGTIGYAAGQGLPMANILVPFSGLLALFGGLSILFGYYARVGALLLILFLVPVTFTMHRFWTVTDPAMYQMQMVQFMKNLSMLGGAIIFAFYGAGPNSLDHKRPSKRDLV
jgi:putative oxidoreductase